MNHPFYSQQNNWDCSLACIFMLANYYHKLKINYFQFIQKHSYFQDLNLLQMQKIADQYGIFLTSYFVQWNDFYQEKVISPLICQIKKNNQFHFVVVYEKKAKKLLIANPWEEKINWIKKEDFQRMYTGVVLTSEKSIYLEESWVGKKTSFIFWNKLLFGLGISFFISILLTGLTILSQFLLKIIIDEIITKQIPETMMTILIGFALLFLNKLILKVILNLVINKVEINFKKRWNFKFFARASQLSFIDYQKYQTNILLQNYKYFNEILNFYFPISFQILEAVFISLVSIFILMTVNVMIILPIMFLTFLICIIYTLLLPWFKRNNQVQIRCEKNLQKSLINLFNNYLDYKNRNLITLPINQLHTEFNNQVEIFKKKINLVNGETIINEIFNFFTTIIIVYLLLNLEQNKLIKPGAFIFLFALINNIINKSSWFFHNFLYWIKLKQLKKQVNAFLFPETNQEKEQAILKEKIKIIEFSDFNYAYDQETHLWKKNLNFTIKQNLVIYGDSGVGKTTLLQILAKNLNYHYGSILINGKFLKTINTSFYQQEVYLLQAKTTVFPGTIFENITGLQTHQDILKIWQQNKIDYFCQKINLSSTSQITNISISNGQRQVINFLALFFRTESLILLDESLNSVPTTWKKELITHLLVSKKNCLILYSSHDQEISQLFRQKINLKKNEN